MQAAFDDQGALFVNGYPVLRSEGVYKGQCVQAVIPLTAGDCLVAGWCDNLNELRTGVAFAPGIDFDTVDGSRYVRFSFAGHTEEIHLDLVPLKSGEGSGE